MKYYIQNRNAGFMGNAPVFWKKGSNGYTCDLNNAEIFDEAEAKRICLGDPEKNKAWSIDYIDNNRGIQRIVDSQYLEQDKQKKFKKNKTSHLVEKVVK